MAKRLHDVLAEESYSVHESLNALVRSNLNAYRRQMTHDRIVASLKPAHVKDSLKQIGWDRLSFMMLNDSKLRKEVEEEIAAICGVEGWHAQGHETDFPEASLASMSKASGVPETRLKQVLYSPSKPPSLGQQLTLFEALALSASMNISLQQLLTPPWWTMHEISRVSFAEVAYLGSKEPIPTDRWLTWLYGWEPLPHQDEFLFERNMSHPPPLGLRLDEAGQRIHRNRHPDFPEINKHNSDGLFSKGSWYPRLNKHRELGYDEPSRESSGYPDQSPLFRHLNASFLSVGILVHIRKLLRVSRRSGRWPTLDTFWTLMTSNISQLLGRLSRLRRLQTMK